MSQFRWLTIKTTPTQAIVQWELYPDTLLSSPATYTLQVSEGLSEWQDVATAQDAYYIAADYKYLFGQQNIRNFRVTVSDGVNYYESFVVKPHELWNRRDFLIVNEIIRRHGKTIDKYNGMPGWLLKRKNFGQKCTDCADTTWSSGSSNVNDDYCATCYGTGFVGGYYDKVKMSVLGVENPRQQDRSAGVIEPAVLTAQAVAIPEVMPEDIWVNEQTGRRYRIIQVQDTVVHRGIVVVSQMAMGPLPLNHPVYNKSI